MQRGIVIGRSKSTLVTHFCDAGKGNDLQNEFLLNERKSVLWVKYEIEYTKTLHQISFQRN